MSDPATGSGPTWRFDYSTAWQTKVTDPNARTTTHHFDRRGQVTKVVDALGHERMGSYDSQSNVVYRTTRRENKTASTYDANNTLTSTKVLMNDRRVSRQFIGTPLFNWVLLAVPIVLTTVVLSFLIEGLVLRTILTVVIATSFWFLLRALAVKWMNHKR